LLSVFYADFLKKKKSQLEKKETPKYQIKEMPMSTQQLQQIQQQQQKELVFKKNEREVLEKHFTNSLFSE
jgi:hypothetical protein